MEYRTLRLQMEGPIARVTLARPEAANRIGARTLTELEAACEAIAASDAVCVTLVTADGRDFCAGWDSGPAETSPPAEAPTPHPNPLPSRGEGMLDPFAPLANLPCPVVVAVQGACLSAGLELALACDIRLAADDARFGLPEVSQGTLPRAGGSQRLSRLAGRSVATSMLLLGDELDAEAAYRAGLVSRVAPAAKLAAAAEAVAAKIAALGPLALRYAKEAVQQGSQLPLDQALRYELDLSVILQTTQDRAEGVQAFLEKRPPRFEGR
ncbi:MAG TPA: enoyl-CoA hydratase/isomerase family protein [Dehalococcoidia bacterium]